MNNQNPMLESTLNSSGIEGSVDTYFYSPIGYRFALLFQKLNVRPDAVVIASLLLGIVAGICFYFDRLGVSLLGILILILANSYYSASIQLTRLTSQVLPIASVLNPFVRNIWFLCIYIALGFRLMPLWGSAWWAIWVLILIAAFFYSKQTSIADYYRNIYLLFLREEDKSKLSISDDITEKYARLSWRRSFFSKLIAYFYRSYIRGQENWTPNLQEMLLAAKSTYGDELPKSFRNTFCQKSLYLIKYTNVLSFNTRTIILFVSVLIGELWLYFVFELTVLNLSLVYIMHKHEKICINMRKEIVEGKYT